MSRAKHGLMMFDSPSGAMDRDAPAYKRRKMQTPRLLPTDDEELEDDHEDNLNRPELSMPRSSRKSLFNTPEKARRRRRADVTPSSERSEEFSSNVNPFFPVTRSTGPEDDSRLSTPSMIDTSWGDSRRDSLDSDSFLSRSPCEGRPSYGFGSVPPSTIRKPRSEESHEKRWHSPGDADGDEFSPGFLCSKLRRTCSLYSNSGSDILEGEEGGSSMVAMSPTLDDLASSTCKTPVSSTCKTPSRARHGGMEDEELLVSGAEGGVSAPRRRGNGHWMKGISKTPQPVPPDSPTKPSHRRNTFGGVPPGKARGMKHFSRFNEEFEEIGVLGGGSFGTVYKCKNRLDGCMYAVKVTKQRFKGKSDRERVLKEVYALSALCNAEDNPHIVRYFSAFVEDGRLYIQTELCDRSLQDMIRERDYPKGLDAVAKDMARQVLEGLAQLHKLNLVHLDIKPANIFVKNGVYKVGDLGHACLARIKVDDTTEQESESLPPPPVPRSSPQSMLPPVHGNPFTPSPDEENRQPPGQMTNLEDDFAMLDADKEVGKHPSLSSSFSSSAARASFLEDIEEGDSRYMAREILNEEYSNLAKGDIFSLGASLYEMCLARELPANGQEWHDIRDGLLDTQALQRYVSPALRELVVLMLLPDPVRRPSAEALLKSGGPGGVLRTEWENKLARERAVAEAYRKRLARIQQGSNSAAPAGEEDDDDRFRFKRSNTM